MKYFVCWDIMVKFLHYQIGAGKTTLMSILSGMIPKNEGEIFVYNTNMENNYDIISKYISYCPQEDDLYEDLTRRENNLK